MTAGKCRKRKKKPVVSAPSALGRTLPAAAASPLRSVAKDGTPVGLGRKGTRRESGRGGGEEKMEMKEQQDKEDMT